MNDTTLKKTPGMAIPKTLLERADAAAAVALQHAADVDATARYPAEAMAELKALKLMSILVPERLGGEGLSLSDGAEVCYRLGRACASTGMIYAMHLVKVACIVSHGLGVAWQEELLRKLARQQLLFSSSTTEGMNGGNVRASAGPITRDGSRITLIRDASVISYGAEADVLVTTARRAPDAEPSDQVLAVFVKPDYEIELTGGWNALGMRGTTSTGFKLTARGVLEQVLPVPYERIHGQTMIPAAHLLWGSVWTGIASAAVQKAQLYVRRAMRGANGAMPPGAPHLTKAHAKLRQARALLAAGLARYEAAQKDAQYGGSLDYQAALTMLKIDVSELAVATVMDCYRCCGLAGYRNDTDVSIGRHLRDVLSSPIMINNDRIAANMAGAIAMCPVPLALND